jgi:hypothetical protein
MTRLNPTTNRPEVYFPISRWGSGSAPEWELVFSVEQYLLIAHEAATLEALRVRLIDEGQRVRLDGTKPRKYQRKVAAA